MLSIVALRQAFDGAQIGAVALDGELRAAAHRPAVDHHRARAAHAVLATDVSAVEAELVADEVGQQRAGLGGAAALAAVDLERDRVA